MSDCGFDSAPQKKCLGCGYVLDHLPENRCPECGRAFDPDDPLTFTRGASSPSRSPSGRRLITWACVGSLLVLSFLIIAACSMILPAPAVHVVESPTFFFLSLGFPVGFLIDVIVVLAVSRARRRGRSSRAHDVAGWIAAGPLAVISLLFILAILKALLR